MAFRDNTGDVTYKSGNTIDVNSKQPTPIVYPTLHPENFAGSNNVMISKDTTLDNVIDSSSLGVTSGYVKDSDLVDGSKDVRFNTLTANEYHVTILSSSIMYANGSNVFGDSADDTHQFTGSILIGGGELSIRLNQATASLQAHSASVDAQLARIYQTTGSLNTYTGSNDTTNTTQNARLTSLEISTGSLSSSLHDGSKNVSFNTVTATSNGLGQNFKVGDDVWLGDRNVSNTMVISGIQEPTSAILQFGSGSQPSIAHLAVGAPFPTVGSALAITGSLLIGHTGHLYIFNGGVSNGGWTPII